MGKHEDHLRTGSDISRTESIICGGMAGLVSRFVISPLDVIKIRLQLGVNTGHSVAPGKMLWTTVTSLYRNEGIRVFWKGNVPAEYLYIMYGAVQFTTYKATTRFCRQNADWIPDSFKLFIAGSTAGFAATTLTYPLDLLRTRFAADSSKQRSSVIGSVYRIHRAEGVRGFFRGLSPTLLSIVPNLGIFFVVYEQVRKVLQRAKLDTLPAPEVSAGFLAGIVSKGMVFPLDVLRKRLQVQGPSYVHAANIQLYPTSMVRFAHHIVVHEGIRAFYKGFLISLLKSGPSSAVTIWTFEKSLLVMKYLQSTSIDERLL
jgi:solute carrier family 25 thiamine pyrophosphate transporter 19